MYNFLRESRVVLQYGSYPLIHLDTISDISCEPTYKQTQITRKTLHSKNRFLKAKTLRSANTITCSMSLYITDRFRELILFELAGWTNYGKGLLYPDYQLGNRPETFTAYIINDNTCYKLYDCIVTTIDISMSKTFAGNMTFGFDASKMEKVQTPTFNYTIYQGTNHLPVTHIETIFGRGTSTSITNAGIAFSRELEYLNNETIHNSSSVISNNKAIITDMNMDIVITSYNDSIPTDEFDKFTIEQSGLRLVLDNAIISKRRALGEVFVTSYDISPTIKTQNIAIYY